MNKPKSDAAKPGIEASTTQLPDSEAKADTASSHKWASDENVALLKKMYGERKSLAEILDEDVAAGYAKPVSKDQSVQKTEPYIGHNCDVENRGCDQHAATEGKEKRKQK